MSSERSPAAPSSAFSLSPSSSSSLMAQQHFNNDNPSSSNDISDSASRHSSSPSPDDTIPEPADARGYALVYHDRAAQDFGYQYSIDIHLKPRLDQPIELDQLLLRHSTATHFFLDQPTDYDSAMDSFSQNHNHPRFRLTVSPDAFALLRDDSQFACEVMGIDLKDAYIEPMALAFMMALPNLFDIWFDGCEIPAGAHFYRQIAHSGRNDVRNRVGLISEGCSSLQMVCISRAAPAKAYEMVLKSSGCGLGFLSVPGQWGRTYANYLKGLGKAVSMDLDPDDNEGWGDDPIIPHANRSEYEY
ncbi:hypothetical protein GQ42DRAFT_152815 [Ramicandelaber brevisporus]|nr:hypothetical protein GQ42DRAFT_152815 [Ramicandelaber brevisporus]